MNRHVLKLLTLATIVACSDSVLYPNGPGPQGPNGPGPGMNPPPGGQPVDPNNPNNANNNVKKGMSLTLEPDAKLVDPDAIEVLFGKKGAKAFTDANGPFDAANNKLKLKIELSLKSTRIDKDLAENYCDSTMTISFVKDSKVVVSRSFTADGSVTLKDIGDDDLMTGSFVDSETKKERLNLSAKRVGSPTVEDANKNAWSGELKSSQDMRDLTIGKIQGFAN